MEAVGERELQALGGELLDVRALDVVGLLELDDAEDLEVEGQYLKVARGWLVRRGERTWIDLKRARWRAAMSE